VKNTVRLGGKLPIVIEGFAAQKPDGPGEFDVVLGPDASEQPYAESNYWIFGLGPLAEVVVAAQAAQRPAARGHALPAAVACGLPLVEEVSSIVEDVASPRRASRTRALAEALDHLVLRRLKRPEAAAARAVRAARRHLAARPRGRRARLGGVEPARELRVGPLLRAPALGAHELLRVEGVRLFL